MADALTNLTYASIEENGLRYVADGATPPNLALEPREVTVAVDLVSNSDLSDEVSFYVGGHTFKLILEEDTLLYGQTYPITIIAVDPDGNEVPLSGDTPIFIGSYKNTFVLPDGTEGWFLQVPYSVARNGEMRLRVDHQYLYEALTEYGLSVVDWYIAVGYDMMPEDLDIDRDFDVPVTLGPFVDVLDADKDSTSTVRIARWDNAYTGPPAYSVRNSAGNHFINRDPERFYVRVTNFEANTNPGAKETLTARIGTAHPEGGDDLTEIELEETDANTGIFLSEAQLMTSPDLPLPANPDDDFAAHDGTSGPVVDDAADDRTHRSGIGGTLKIEYQSSEGLVETEAHVCYPDSIRTLRVTVVVFNEPYQDVGYVTASGDTVGAGNGVFDYADVNGNGLHDAGEPSEEYRDLSVYTPIYDSDDKLVKLPRFLRGNNSISASGDGRGPISSEAEVQRQIRRANIAWAQACIRIVQWGETRFKEAPTDEQGASILKDGMLAPISEGKIVHDAYKTGMNSDVAHVFFAGPLKVPAYGRAYIPAVQRFPHGAHSFTFIAPNLDPAYRTLAHEIGHLLSNRGDDPNPRPIFFPALYTGLDVSVNSYRRITHSTMINCRTVRPAGNLNAVGNRLLHN